MSPLPRSNVPIGRAGTGLSPGAGSSARDELVVVTWNVLADSLSDAFPKVPASELSWTHRSRNILAELTLERPFGRLPDLICLQEVDRFDELAAGLAREGFVGTWFPKAEGRDGVALFHLSTALERVPLDDPEASTLRFRQPSGEPASQVALVERFRRPEGSTLLVATTHLRAKVGHEAERLAQAQQLCAHLARVRSAGEPLVVAGDFNDTPDSLAVSAMLGAPLGLASAYGSHHAARGAWTTWKIREHETQRVIDYVFHTAELAALELLDAPAPHEVGPQRLPDRQFPSDHLNLAVRFRLG
ncbi:MAG: endonuclease/exonuclease/phosphatase family protein [Planctomycetota bacterium]